MALYAIGDLHLSLGTNKPMDVFGPKWAKTSVERIRENFSKLNDDDVIVIGGDIVVGDVGSSSRCRIFSLLTRCRGGRSS